MSLTHSRARVASLSRSRSSDDPELLNAKRELHEQRLAAHIERTLALAPPLTAEQKARLAVLLSGGDAA